MEVNSSPRRFYLLLALGLLVVVLGVYCALTLGEKSVVIGGSGVPLNRTSSIIQSDPTGGMTGTKLTNYTYLVDHYGIYAYADVIQKYLSAYLRIAHDEPYKTMTIDEKTYKNVDDKVSTFTVFYGDKKALKVKTTNDWGFSTYKVEVVSDDGKPASFSTGTIDIDTSN